MFSGFFYPFSFGKNPFNSFSSIGFGIAFVYNAEYFFIDLFAFFSQSLGVSVPLSERLFIILTMIISNVGFFLLAELLASIRNVKSELILMLSILLYWFNPFTITTTFYHLLFFMYQAILPFIFLIILLIYKRRYIDYRMFLSWAILLFFGPALYGSYSDVILFITFSALVLFFFRFIKERNIKYFSLDLIFLALSFGIETYYSLMFLYFTHSNGILSLNFLTGGLSSPSQIMPDFSFGNLTTQIYRVISLTAFSWLYFGKGANSYAWFYWFPLITIIGYLFFCFFVLSSMLVIKKNILIFFMVILSLIFIVFSTGSNFPFAYLNSYFVNLEGPFLILINAYYFFMEVYILTFSLIVFFLLQNIANLPPKWTTFLQPTHTLSPARDSSFKRKISSIKSIKNKNIIITRLAVIISTIILVGSIFPLAINGEFMNHGTNIDAFMIPQSFSELHDYFEVNYSGPDYYVLVLPMSQIGAVDMQIGNGSFADSSNIFTSLIPYPLLDWAVTNQTIALDNILFSNSSVHVVPLLEAAHIKYLVINPYVNMSQWYMDSTPNGEPVNINRLQRLLENEDQYPHYVGRFVVFKISGVNPLVDLYTQQTFISSQSINSYYQMISKINDNNSNVSKSLINAIPVVGNREHNLVEADVHSINDTSPNILSSNSSDSGFYLNNNGNISMLSYNSTQYDLRAFKNYKSIQPSQDFGFNESSLRNATTNFIISNSTLKTNSTYSYLWDNKQEFSNDTFITGTLNFGRTSYKYRWVNVYINSSGIAGNLYDEFTLLEFNGSNYIQSSLLSLNSGSLERLSWTGVKLPSQLPTKAKFQVLINSDSLIFCVEINDSQYSIVVPINPILQPSGGGINQTLVNQLQLPNTIFSKYTVGVVTINNNLTLQNVSVFKKIDFSTVFIIPNNFFRNKIFAPSFYSIQSGYAFNIQNTTGKIYPIIFTSNSSLVKIFVKNGVLVKSDFSSFDVITFAVILTSHNAELRVRFDGYSFYSRVIYLAIVFLIVFLVFSTTTYLWKKFANNIALR